MQRILYYMIYSIHSYDAVSLFLLVKTGTFGDNVGTTRLRGYGHRTLKTCDGI